MRAEEFIFAVDEFGFRAGERKSVAAAFSKIK